MNRACFLCGCETENVFASTWVLPGLAAAEIGFSICPECGSVCQSPSVPFQDMMKYYSTIAVYTNPGRQEKPSEAKVRDLDEQIQFIKRGIGCIPDSVLQIGSSDGYTLSRFKEAGVSRILGVEPGAASVALAKKLYGVDSVNSCAEEFETELSFDLILMTHVLEHLYDPQSVLKKCRKIQENSQEGFIYIEVPLMANPNSLCPGFFSFEHINYYTRDNLLRSVIDVGYFPVSVVEHYNSNLSPIVGVLASTKTQFHFNEFVSSYQKNRTILSDYRNKEVSYWQACLDGISPALVGDGRIFLWGAGIHTSQLVANTSLLNKYKIHGLTDTSSLKWGIVQGDWVCQDPAQIDWRAGDRVIISSYASEKEIYDALSWLREKGVITLRLHNIDDSKAH